MFPVGVMVSSIIGHERFKPTKSSAWYIFSCPPSSIAMNSFLLLVNEVFLSGLLDEEALAIGGGGGFFRWHGGGVVKDRLWCLARAKMCGVGSWWVGCGGVIDPDKSIRCGVTT